MARYILKRCLLIVPTMIGISILTFAIIRLSPGDPLSAKYGLNPEITQADITRIRELYELDKPMTVQYLSWLSRIARFDFGRSFIDDKPVITKIAEALPATLLLNALSLALILLVGIPLGVMQAVWVETRFDKIFTFAVFIAFSIPSFWLALVLIYFFGFKLEWFPISGLRPWYAEYLTGFASFRDLAWHLALPVFATSISGLAGITRYMRMSMLECLGKEYIFMAHAKGLPMRRIYFHHALRNALLPIVTLIGLSLPGLISGSVIFESIFAWPGMGRMGYMALMNFDIPVVMGVGVMAGFLTLAGILISDIVYSLIDPRISYAKK